MPGKQLAQTLRMPESIADNDSLPRVDRGLEFIALVAIVAILAFKLLLTRLLNINWDEFYFLTHVYSLVRGELSLRMLGAYTHAFTWLTRLPADEIGQIMIARAVMVALLGVTTWLIYQAGRRWLTGFPSLVPPYLYLTAVPVMVHGGSFRSDSLIAPLSVGAIALLAHRPSSWRYEYTAGALLGIACAISIKVVLFTPLIVGLLLLKRPSFDGAWPTSRILGTAVWSCVRVAIATLATASILLWLHDLTLATAPDSVAASATSAARKTLIDAPWFPRWEYFSSYIRWQPLYWLLIATGAIIALAKREFACAVLALGLLPLAFYRNAFPYYYVVMLAPASVLAGFAVQETARWVRRRRGVGLASTFAVVIWTGLLYQGITYNVRLLHDGVANQRMLLSAIHQVFREPVSYVDRCGMVPSFRKVNFFMSTWGMEKYRQARVPFMPEAIRETRPAFVLVNAASLNPNRRREDGLLSEDYDLIARFYPKYWGPLRVAGAQVDIGSTPTNVLVPFADSYRIDSKEPVTVDGKVMHPGEVVFVPEEGVAIQSIGSEGKTVSVRLSLASAHPAPEVQLPGIPLFSGL
jgi:hypothetical protein